VSARPALRAAAEPLDAPAATVALAALTLAAAAGMGRLFAGTGHLLPFAVAGLVAHGVMWLGRRRGVPLVANVALAAGAVVVAIVWVVLPETTVLGLPGPGTIGAAGDALELAWSDFNRIVAPVPQRDGFLLAGMFGVGMTAVLADWAAFRMGVLFEALLPSFTLFVFTAALGADAGRAPLVALYLAALLAFLVLHSWNSHDGGTSWFASRTAGGRHAVARGGVIAGVVAVLAALVAGPNLPGADDPPVLALRDADRPGGGRRSTVSPLVDIRGRLVEQSATEVFTVRSTARSYWRLTSLDTFNGSLWSSDASYEPAGSRLPGDVPAPGVAVDRVVQEFVIGSLSSIWLPAGYRPERIEGAGEVSFNEDLGSLITERDTTDGLTYRVQSAVPRLTARDLAGGPDATAGTASDVDVGRFLRLDGVSPDVARLARTIAQGSDGTVYGRAKALQDFFQEGFTYDLSARPGHDGPALDTFLFRDRRGYCEQFAGAYGVLARLMGLPTRVAVGFTPGELGPDGRYLVRGLNAHAWPEVFFSGAGWVAFEPTPGRGAPGAEDYTGLPENQADPRDATTATTAAPTTTAPAAPEDTATAPAAPEDLGTAPDAATGPSVWRNPLLRSLALAVLALVLVAGGTASIRAARRHRRRRAATTAGDRVLVAWEEAADALALAGARRQPAETLAEHAVRAPGVAPLSPEAGGALRTLADDATAASYAGGPVGTLVAERAVAAAATVESALRDATPWWRRAARAADPRTLRRHRGG
jgi:transglutaminase-like putative cysteine protease